jgi:hypothetical protein
MSCVIVRGRFSAQAPSMSWEEDPLMERLFRLFRSTRVQNAHADDEAQRRRSGRLRYFLSAFGAAHWAERTEGRRT